MSAYIKDIIINIAITLCVSNLYATEFISTRYDPTVATSSFAACKAIQLKDNLYATFNKLKSSITHYSKQLYPYRLPIAFAAIGSANLYNAYTAANRFTKYLAHSLGLPLLGLSFYEAYEQYTRLAQDQQIKANSINIFKQNVEILKKYVMYIVNNFLTQPNFKGNNLNNTISVIRQTVINNKNTFDKFQSLLQDMHPDEYAKLPEEEKLSASNFVQKVILDNLGSSVALTTNAEGNYVIDTNNPVNKHLNQLGISNMLNTIFSTRDEFSFDKKLIESFFTKQTTSPIDKDQQQTLKHLYLQ